MAEVISEININLAMVEDGQAFAYRQYLSGCNAKEYLDANTMPAGDATGSGRCQAGSADPGTSARAVAPR